MATWSYLITPPAVGVAGAADVFPLAPIASHADLAKARLLEQFHHLPRMEAFVADIVATLQPLEDLGWQLLRERYLYAIDGQGPAVGEQLDGIGEIVGETRNGRTDDHYREMLKVRILVNVSDGTWPDLHAILALLPLTLDEAEQIYPAHIWFEVTEALYGYGAWPYLRDAKAGGVGMTLVISAQLRSKCFQFSGTYGAEEQNADTGFGGAYVITGGYMAGVGQ